MLSKFKPVYDVVYDVFTVDTIVHDGQPRDILIDNRGKAIYLSRDLPHNLALRLRVRAERGQTRLDVLCFAGEE